MGFPGLWIPIDLDNEMAGDKEQSGAFISLTSSLTFSLHLSTEGHISC